VPIATIGKAKTLQIGPPRGSENDNIMFRDANPKRSTPPPPPRVNARVTADNKLSFNGTDFGTQDISLQAIQSLFPI